MTSLIITAENYSVSRENQWPPGAIKQKGLFHDVWRHAREPEAENDDDDDDDNTREDHIEKTRTQPEENLKKTTQTKTQENFQTTKGI